MRSASFSFRSAQAIGNLVNVALLCAISCALDYQCLSSSKSNGCGVCVAAPVHRNDWKDLIITIRERDKLHLLKERVRHRLPEYTMHSDFYLIRWLRAKNLNVDKAEKMLLENVRWRQENRISTILTEDFSDVSDEYLVTTDCVDKNNRPVGTINFGNWDISQAVLRGNLPRLVRLVDYFLEDLVHQVIEAQASGTHVTRAIVLVDMEGFSFFQHACPTCISVFIRLVIGMETHYPGFWEEIIIVNAPSIFRVVFDGLRGVISTQNRETLTMFDKNKMEWMHYLDERIKRDQRYPNYGGSKEIQE